MRMHIEYRKRAAEFARVADRTDDLEHMERYLRLASFWVDMADNEEWLHHNSLSGTRRGSEPVGEDSSPR